MAKKIQLNSLYGALSNVYFRWFNFDNAESITTSGQLTIKYIDKAINTYLNKTLKTKDKDYIIASDTDSVYIDFSELVKHLNSDDDLIIVKALDIFCEQKMQPFLEKYFNILGDTMSAYQQKMQMKRETIANKGIWRGKKMYILNAWNVEGVQYDKPKLKLSGIEAVRSSTPHACREKIKQALSIVMNGNLNELRIFVEEFRAEFDTLPFESVAFPRGVRGMKKYQDSSSIYKKGTPIQVKAALLFNNLLLQHKLKLVPPISDGDKIRFAYLKMPNPIRDTVIATADHLPTEFNLDNYIDRDLQFEKSFMEPLRSITEVINWDVDNRATLEDFFG
jgi:DNA polymerase elongation subunit (family B)